MKEKKTVRKRREVVEMMLTGAERTSLVTDRMKRLYEDGREGSKEGQSETASPEGRAAETVQEEVGRTPRESVCVARQVSRTAERIKRVRETKAKASHVPSARAVGIPKTVPAGERMRASALKQTMTRAKEAVVNSAKAVYHGIKSSATMIATGGGVVVLVILIICMTGMIFGIFFVGSQGSTERTIYTVMRELDTEYDQKIAEIQNSNEHDVLEMHGARPEWKEVLAVYAVKTNLDPSDSDELISMMTQKEKKLRDVFWDMVKISSKVEIEKRIVTTSVIDEFGNVTEKKEEKEVTVLIIRITNLSAGEMAVKFGFDSEQEKLLKEFLDARTDLFWGELLP